MKASPPRRPISFLRWFCRREYLEEIEGNLTQIFLQDFEVSPRNARLKFTWNVIRHFRPQFVRPVKFHLNQNSIAMYKNYFTTAWRNVSKHKFYSALTIAGLTIGLAVSALVLLWVDDESSFDRFHQNAAHIYRINTAIGKGPAKSVYSVTPGSVANYASKEIPGVANSVRWDKNRDYSVISYKDRLLNKNTLVYTDPSFFKVFDFPLLSGDKLNPFPTPGSVIITKSTAKKYFGDEQPNGKVLQADHKDNFTVSGVIDDFPANSSLQADIIFSTDWVKHNDYGEGKSFWKSLDDDWGGYRWTTYLLLDSRSSIKSTSDKLNAIAAQHNPDQKPSDLPSFQLQALSKTHLFAPDGSSAGSDMVRLFTLVAILILLIASINYVNLSTARAMLRAKEVTLRKIVGASRLQLINQFIIETILFFTAALLLAIAAIYLLMPLYNSISGKQLHFSLLNVNLWKVLLPAFAGTVAAACIYPALLLSSFKPVQSLKGKLSAGTGNGTFRKVLVVSQFVFSVALITGTLVIHKQLDFIKRKELGYNKTNVFSLPLHAMQAHYAAVKTSLLQSGDIADVTSANGNIINIPGATLDVDWDGKDENQTYFIHSTGIDDRFFSFFQLQLVAGTGFRGSQADSTHFILNETAVKEAGLKNPIGKRFRVGRTSGIITGIVKDFHFTSLKQKIQPFLFYYQPTGEQLFVKSTGSDPARALATVQAIYKNYNPGFPFEFSFMDDSYDKLYKSDQRTGTLFDLFAAITIIISCLGLFGLAAYTAQVRVKEIGIRKTLGASTENIFLMLSGSFLRLVLMAMVIAFPVAWWWVRQWLTDFAYHTSIPGWIFLVTAAGACGISLLVISFHAIRAARANPVKSLKAD